MNSKHVFALTLPAALAASVALGGTALAQSPARNLGVAIMGASVSHQGYIYPDFSSGVVSARRTAVGEYEVKFVRSLYGCTPSVSALLQTTIAAFAGVQDEDGDETLAQVWTHDPAGTPADGGFTIVWFCSR